MKNTNRLGLAVCLGALLAYSVSACATVRHDPLYDGDLGLPVISGESATLIRVVIDNARSTEGIAPHFYLIGLGRHPLGAVEPFTKATAWVDTKWIPSDGQLLVVAHYAGVPDVVSERIQWHPGEFIDVKFNSGGQLLVAWSHR
jgi:hypothetical protein